VIRASKKIEADDGYAFAVSLLSFIPYVRIWRCLDYDAAVRKNPALVKVVAGDAVVSTRQILSARSCFLPTRTLTTLLIGRARHCWAPLLA
jgi:hypothetical protein